MLKYEYVLEQVNGEPPPVIFVYGTTRDFHELLIALLPFLKLADYSLSNQAINLFPDADKVINVSKSAINACHLSEKALNIEITQDTIIDAVINITGLCYEESTWFCEYDWLMNFSGSIIFESMNSDYAV